MTILFALLGLSGLSAILYAFYDLFKRTERAEGVMHRTDQFWEMW